MTMYYVYSRHIESGREDYIGQYLTMKEAVAKCRQCYNIDAGCAAKDEYYYFIKQH